MDVRDHEIRVVQLNVQGRSRVVRRIHQISDQKHEKAEGESHCRSKPQRFPGRPSEGKEHYWHEEQQRKAHKNATQKRVKAHNKGMVDPNKCK